PTAPVGTGTMTQKQTAARRLRRAVRVLVALIAAFLLLGVMTALGVTLGTGSSLSGGAGNSTYVPLSAAAVQPNYRLGAGDLNVNLTQVQFPASGQAVDVTVGLGNLTIEVPKDAVVDVHARSGIGQVDVFGQSGSNVTATEYGGGGDGSNAPHLTVDAHVGIGNLQVSQG
ncbi:MAG TPA: LiaF domain-containing protein, partial [Acidimicrobiales bacterium]|nr:LiaF domain-containing protein [Acidimicrobiales bacterium]